MTFAVFDPSPLTVCINCSFFYILGPIAVLRRCGLSRSIAWYVGLSVMIVSPAKTAEPIEIPFGMWTRAGPRNRVLDGVQITTREGANMRGKVADPTVHVLKAIQQGHHRYCADADWVY